MRFKIRFSVFFSFFPLSELVTSYFGLRGRGGEM